MIITPHGHCRLSDRAQTMYVWFWIYTAAVGCAVFSDVFERREDEDGRVYRRGRSGCWGLPLWQEEASWASGLSSWPLSSLGHIALVAGSTFISTSRIAAIHSSVLDFLNAVGGRSAAEWEIPEKHLFSAHFGSFTTVQCHSDQWDILLPWRSTRPLATPGFDFKTKD